jgi:2-methylisocitrate lyase-like PEP mutase family enzyme
VVRSLDRPVNVLGGLAGARLSLADLSGLGVRRVSVGSLLSRAAFGAFLRASSEMYERGTFSFSDDAVPYKDLSEMFGRATGGS